MSCQTIDILHICLFWQNIEIWPQILHPMARTKFHVALDIFTAPDPEREANCFDRAQQIERDIAEGFFPPNTNYCADIHLSIRGFAAGKSL